MRTSRELQPREKTFFSLGIRSLLTSFTLLAALESPDVKNTLRSPWKPRQRTGDYGRLLNCVYQAAVWKQQRGAANLLSPFSVIYRCIITGFNPFPCHPCSPILLSPAIPHSSSVHFSISPLPLSSLPRRTHTYESASYEGSSLKKEKGFVEGFFRWTSKVREEFYYRIRRRSVSHNRIFAIIV